MSGFRANSIVNREGTGAPNIPNGIVATGATFTQVSSVNATFSGNLTIGGTVSYQEVGNIDAVGVITAQQGIQVEANGLTVTGVGTFNNPIKVVGVTTADANGLNVVGVITATTFKGNGANLTGTLPVFSGISSGALTDGQTVIIQTDGKVAGVVTTGFTESLGSATVFESADLGGSTNGAIYYDSTNDKIVVAYIDAGNSSYGTACVGTVSGTSITFGTPVVFNSGNTKYISIDGNGSGQVVIAYRDDGNSDYGTAIAGTISGNSISFGTESQFLSESTDYPSVTYDPNQESYVIAYRRNSNGNIRARCCTVSGTTFTYGSHTDVFALSSCNEPRTVYDTANQKVVIICSRSGGSKAIVGTVSGTSISFGSSEDFESGEGVFLDMTYDTSASAVLITFTDTGDSYKSKLIAGTVSGTSISFGTAVVYASGTNYARANGVAYNAASETNSVFFQDYGSPGQPGKYLQATVSGTTVTVNSAQTFDTGSAARMGVAYDSTNKVTVVMYRDANNSGYGTAIVFRSAYVSTNLTSSNFLGFSDAAYSDGATATIQITGSVDDAQSGLTTAKKHYVQNDGTLSTTAGTPSVEAGTAVSATKIIVKG